MGRHRKDVHSPLAAETCLQLIEDVQAFVDFFHIRLTVRKAFEQQLAHTIRIVDEKLEPFRKENE